MSGIVALDDPEVKVLKVLLLEHLVEVRSASVAFPS
jgi:hypothetical protein